MGRSMEEENKSGKTEVSTRATGKMAKATEKAD